jgi:hypothetical protein
MADCLVFSKLSHYSQEIQRFSTILAEVLGDDPNEDYHFSDWSSLEDYCLEPEDLEMLQVLLGFMVKENMELHEVCRIMNQSKTVH